ncbi:MAG: alpha-E domain-containing protein [Planctomycetaceae bacterium]
MLSRVANSIYWMSRNVERAEHMARFMEVTLNFILDQPDSDVEQWGPLVRATGDEEYFATHYGEFTSGNVLQFLTFDRDYHSSIDSAIRYARENARTVREAISSEAWEQLNEFYHFVRDAASDSSGMPDATFYQDIVKFSFEFNGTVDATMTRDTGWHFGNVGRMLERADKTSRILDVKYFTLLRNVGDVNTTYDDLLWSSVLRSASGFEMFRKRYHSLTVERIVEFLILDHRFPRAVRYSVQQARSSLSEVAGPVPDEQNEALLRTDRLLDRLDSLQALTIINSGVHEFVDWLQTSLNEIGDAIQQTYMAARPFPAAVLPSPSQTQMQSQ